MMPAKVLVVTSDHQLYWDLSPTLQHIGLGLHVQPDTSRTFADLQACAYEALIVDCCDSKRLEFLREAFSIPRALRSPIVAITARPETAFQLRACSEAVWQQPLLVNRVTETLLGFRAERSGDHRIHQRSELSSPAALRYSYDGVRFHQATVAEISESGMRIQAIEILQSGRTVHVEFALPAFRTRVVAAAQVVWRSPAGDAGLRFLQLPENVRGQIRRWIEANSRPFASTVGLLPARPL